MSKFNRSVVTGEPCWPKVEESAPTPTPQPALIAELLAALEHALEHYDLDPELQHVFRAAIEKARKA